jgi:RNA polymerase primary sigma factor
MSPSEATINMDLAEQTRKILSTLTPREEKVLRMRFGISERFEQAFEEDRDVFEVKRIEIKPMDAGQGRKLRNPSQRRLVAPLRAK